MIFSQEVIFLFILLILGLLSKNSTIVISSVFLLLIRFLRVGDKIYPSIEKHGVNIGIIFIMIAVLIPIAKGEVRLQDLFETFKSSYGIIALISGLIVAILGAYGIQLLNKTPEVTISLILGIIMAVFLFKGIPVGPLIGAGIALVIIKIVDFIKNLLI